MKDLWTKRLSNYVKEIAKYGRLIMNDHFSIILVIILAFIGLYYRELILQLQTSDLSVIRWPIMLVVSLWLMVAFQYGRPLWLTKDSDSSYLFARGQEWQAYWLKGTLVSLLVPAIVLALATIMVMPFLELVTAWTLADSWLLIALMIAFKAGSFLVNYLSIFGFLKQVPFIRKRWQHSLLVGLMIFLSLLMPRPYNLYFLLAVVVGLLITIFVGFQQAKKGWMAFDYVVEEEIMRESTFYKWIAVFADVPHLKPSVKRRAYLDGFIKGLPFLNRDRYSYLYIRAIFRNNAYSGVWIRVMIFMMVLLAFTESYWIGFGLGVAGHLLTVVQLIPLLQAYQTHPMQIIYPNRRDSAVKSFQNVLFLIIIIQCLAYGLVAIFSIGISLDFLVLFLAWLFIGISLAYFYVPWWYQKQNKF